MSVSMAMAALDMGPSKQTAISRSVDVSLRGHLKFRLGLDSESDLTSEGRPPDFVRVRDKAIEVLAFVAVEGTFKVRPIRSLFHFLFFFPFSFRRSSLLVMSTHI